MRELERGTALPAAVAWQAKEDLEGFAGAGQVSRDPTPLLRLPHGGAAGDRAADLRQMEGSPSHMRNFLLGLQRSVGNGHVQRVVQRKDEAPDPGGPKGVTFPGGGSIVFTPKVQRFNEDATPSGPEIAITDPSQNVFLGQAVRGEHGSIRFFIDVRWDFTAGHPETHSLTVPTRGSARLVTLTPFRVLAPAAADSKADDDKVKFSKTRPTLAFSEGTGASLDKQPTTSEDADDRGGSVTVAPSVTFQVQSADAKQVGAAVTILVFSPQFARQLQIALNETESVGFAYTANIAVPKDPEPAKPGPPEPKKKNSRFRSDRFAGQPTLEACGRGTHRMLPGEADHQAVQRVQQTLVEAGFLLEVDGKFGPATETAVAKFKSAHGIVPSDGVVGPQTSHALDEIAAEHDGSASAPGMDVGSDPTAAPAGAPMAAPTTQAPRQ